MTRSNLWTIAAVALVGLGAFALTGRASADTGPETHTAAALVQETGEEIFLENGCRNCHSVEEAGISSKGPHMAAPDLSTVDLPRQTIKDWLNQRRKREGELHPVKFTAPESELDTLVDWLRSDK